MAFRVTQNHKVKNSRQIVSEINVTPLVDVMLVLLVVFMITSPFLVAGIKVDLPTANLAPIGGQEEPVSISIDKDQKIYIQNAEIKINELAPKLKAVTKQNSEISIYVRGDKHVNYGKVMEVVAEINKSGFSKIALLTEIQHD
jgi:biopolymer transport protein TolR